MKQRLLLPFFCSLFSLAAFSQRELKNPLIDSKKQIDAGVALHDKKEYKAAIKEYLKVPAGDTNYSSVLHELYLSSYMDGNYADAEKYVTKAMEMFPEKNNEWLGMLANVYDDTKRRDKAIAIYDSVLSVNKYAYLVYFNRGVSLVAQEKYDAAAADFQKVILLNPYYSSAHYYLGALSFYKGNLVQAMMSFATAMLISPSNKYKNNIISYMNSIAEVNTSTTDALKKYKPGNQDNFESVQDIVTNKIALDKKYKVQADLEDQIVRQLQVIMEKLEYDPSDKGFWMQYYVPLYKKIWETKNFEPFIFYMFSDLDIKAVKDYNKKEKKKIEQMSELTVAYLNDIRETEKVDVAQRALTKTRYYIKDYIVSGKGEYTKGEKDEVIFNGPWEFYYPTGNLKSTGVLTNDVLNGEWKYYYESGLLKNVVNYRNGKAEGKGEGWFDNGVPASSGMYRDDKREGSHTAYYFNGNIQSVVNYKNNLREGQAKFYTVNGDLSSTSYFKNDKYDGEEIHYYENGKVSAKQNYVADKAEGPHVEYHENGKIKLTGTYAGDEKTGEWKSFYENGQTEYVKNYNKGKLSGEYISYYENGKLETKSFYTKDEVDGKSEQYDDDGILYQTTIFEKGRLRDISFFDKKGGLIANNSSRKGNADLTFYLPDGSKSEEGYYTKDGLKDGKHTNFFRNGKANVESNYKDGVLEGKRIFWYANGKVSQEGNYNNGEANGYFVDYHNNGAVSSEGWYVEGLRQGTHLYYNPEGNLTNRSYYINDQSSGVQEIFHPNGKPDYTQYYDNDWLLKEIQYDTLGNVLTTSDFKKGEGKMVYLHYNGKPYIENYYKHYERNGQARVINADGSIAAVYYYKNGKLDSTYRSIYTNGKVQTEGQYAKGNKTGMWTYYYRDGKLMSKEAYVDNLPEGKDLSYGIDGNVEKEVSYSKGKLNGESRFYAAKELALVLYYKDDILTGYSYPDKTGALVPTIVLKGGSGQVTSYFKNGNKSASIRFNESLAEGDRIFYWPTGKEFVVGKRANGLDVGVKKVFYADGKLMKEENYLEGLLHGPAKYYSPTGAVISEENYYLNDLHGVSKYNENGKTTEFRYYYGALEEKK